MKYLENLQKKDSTNIQVPIATNKNEENYNMLEQQQTKPKEENYNMLKQQSNQNEEIEIFAVKFNFYSFFFLP